MLRTSSRRPSASPTSVGSPSLSFSSAMRLSSAGGGWVTARRLSAPTYGMRSRSERRAWRTPLAAAAITVEWSLRARRTPSAKTSPRDATQPTSPASTGAGSSSTNVVVAKTTPPAMARSNASRARPPPYGGRGLLIASRSSDGTYLTGWRVRPRSARNKTSSSPLGRQLASGLIWSVDVEHCLAHPGSDDDHRRLRR